MRILTANSKLRRLPSLADPRQALYLDGIRYAVEMFDVAYERLANELLRCSKQKSVETSFPSIFLDAWSAVDSLHRLREIVGQTPHFKKTFPSLVVFMKSTAQVEDMRHFAQHLRRELDALASTKRPVHGVLVWIEVVDFQAGRFRSHAMASGRVVEGSLSKFALPMGRLFRWSIDHIELHVRDGLEFSLSEGREEIAKLVAAIESSIPNEWADAPRLGADLHVALDLATATTADPAE